MMANGDAQQEANEILKTPVRGANAADEGAERTQQQQQQQADEGSEGSLQDILETPRANDANDEEDNDDEVLQQLLQDALGITVTGTCLRHANCPVVTGLLAPDDEAAPATKTRVVSCRICYAEEKSVGIRQPKTTFATVVQQLHRQADEEQLQLSFQQSHNSSSANIFHSSLNASGGAGDGALMTMVMEQEDEDDVSDHPGDHSNNSSNSSPKINAATKLLLFLQQDPSAMESVMKRLAQVQNWALRKKEQQVVKLQLHCQRLEKQVADLQRQSNDQRSTIQSLRRNIQQDLKVIKTFAKQQQMQEEADLKTMQQQQQLMNASGHQASPAPGNMQSPAKLSQPSPQLLANRASKSSSSQDASVTNSFSPPPLSSKTSFVDSSIPIPEDGEQDLEAAEAATTTRRGKQSFYWNGDEHKHQSSRNIFQSFRGGLLDIPKSPPRARHDRDNAVVPVERKKLQLNRSAMNALQLPERALSRSNSAAVPQGQQPKSSSLEIPLDVLADKMAALPPQRNLHGKSPEQLFPAPVVAPSSSQAMPAAPALDDNNKVVSGTYSIMSMSTAAVEAPTGSATEKTTANASSGNEIADKTTAEASSSGQAAAAGSPSAGSEKFIFSVTEATCQDKFGDEGTYTGSILVTEGLPHGLGKMDYESGRVYQGEWVSGQWHGKGKLLNPNGDSYEGEFFFDARHGHGVYRWDNGDVYVGQFSSDKRHGKGKFNFHNGNVYEGEFCDGMFEGFGRYDFSGGYYEGDWKEGRYDGSGELLYSNGGKYTGEFRHSVAHGIGMEVLPDGTKKRGLWVDGKPTDGFGNK